MSSVPSTSSSISRKKYDVFLSFRGEDTRKNFTDHLYDALKRSGIVTFWDDPKLEAGEEIPPQLFRAIQQSWCSVIVFSGTYAFSSWCLEELAEIVKQKNEKGHKVFPIFYDVDPSDLRKQKEKLEEAFAKHEERYTEDKEKILRWRNALTQVASIKGWHLNNRHESGFIGDIVRKISAKLCQAYPVFHDELVGISSRLEELYSKIEIGEDDIRIIGISGMGGIGKTTLARVVYDQMSSHFEGKCFIADVREVSDKFGLVSLQKQLLFQILSGEVFEFFNVHEGNAIISRRLSHKKVLVVIDDVDNLQHLKCLFGRRDWFGLGSRIIITTRDEHLLRSYQVDDVYTPATLNPEDASHLFNLKAFDSVIVAEDDLMKLSKHVVRYAGGLPLALEVLGSFFCGRDAAQWRSAIERLEKDSNKEILDRLRISFDGLEETEKNIFLDIACFFNGKEKDFVMKVLDGCEFFPDIGIDVLIKKSLLKVDKHNKYLWMHDLLQEMGRKIVREKSVEEPGKRSRLWEERDVYHTLTRNTATEVIEGMIIDNKRELKETLKFNVDAFSKMKRLRLLKVCCLFSCNDLKYLSNQLRLLDWEGYPLRSLPSSFQPDNLVALLLPHSRIEQLWKGNPPLYKLKVLNLRRSENLIKTPDFTTAPNLEILIFEYCIRIIDVHPSIGALRRLKLLNLRGCKSLRNLPTKIGMESLETLILSGCSKIQRFPEIDGKMECLKTLNLSGCYAVENLPSRVGGCTSLKTLNLSGCYKVLSLNRRKGPDLPSRFRVLQRGRVESMPPTLHFLSGLSSLRELRLRNCNLCEGDIPSDISCLSTLKQLDLSGNNFSSMSSFITRLSKLQCLELSNSNLHSLSEGDISCLSSLTYLDLSGNNFISIPASLARLPKLALLDLRNCKELKYLPEITSIGSVYANGCTSLELVSNPSKVCNSVSWAQFSGLHCYRLAENINALTLLKKHLKAFGNSRNVFDIAIPGREIPEWFSHQRVGSSIKVPLPNNIRNDSRWMGVAFCCIFVNDDASRDEGLVCKAVVHHRKSGQAGCDGSGSGDRNAQHLINCGFQVKKGRIQPLVKDHIFLCYWQRHNSYPFSSEDKFVESEIEGSSTTDRSNQAFDELQFSITSSFGFGCLKVKRCGVRIVYEKDLEDVNEKPL